MNRVSPYDRASFAVIAGCILLLLAAYRDIIPVPPDGYYHLLVARRILEDGRVPLWDWWEFAPDGRPHLYPPLFHLLIVALSLPFQGDLLSAFRVLVALLLPATLLGVWYLARRLFDAPRAFAALLLLGWDPMFALMGLMAIPSILAGGVAAAAIYCFYARRFTCASAWSILCFYLHPGIGPFLLLGLLLFSLIERAWLRPFLLMAAVVLAAAFPWYIRFWWYREWHLHPLEAGYYGDYDAWQLPLVKATWLQFLNLGMVGLVVWAWRRRSKGDPRTRLLLCAALAYLPLLLSYGGRFYLHSAPYWAILAAEPVSRFVTRPRRALALALCPTLVLVGHGTIVPPGLIPMVSGWTFPLFLGLQGGKLLDGGGKLGLVSYREAEELAARIRELTSPGDIVHYPDRDVVLMLGFLADRPIDEGAWEEYSGRDYNALVLSKHRDELSGCYVSKYKNGLPKKLKPIPVGRFYLGIAPSPKQPQGP